MSVVSTKVTNGAYTALLTIISLSPGLREFAAFSVQIRQADWFGTKVSIAAFWVVIALTEYPDETTSTMGTRAIPI